MPDMEALLTITPPTSSSLRTRSSKPTQAFAVKDGRLARLWSAGSALASGILLGAIQLIPTWEHFAGSVRFQPSYEFLTDTKIRIG